VGKTDPARDREVIAFFPERTVHNACGPDWAVLDWNEPAIQFYRKLGAVPIDEWTKYRLTAEALKSLALSRGSNRAEPIS
jgi:hypothetical protein